MQISMFEFACRVVVIAGSKGERFPLAGLRLVEREMDPRRPELPPFLPPMTGARW